MTDNNPNRLDDGAQAEAALSRDTPSLGETQAEAARDATWPDREDGVSEFLAEYSKFINERPMLLSLLYDIDMLPEQTVSLAGAIRLAGLCEVWKKGESGALSRPVAPGEVEGLVAELEAGLEGVTPGPWAAYMDDYTVRVDESFIPAQRKIALCATGDGAGKNAAHLARCSPDNIRKLIASLRSLAAKCTELEAERSRLRCALIATGRHIGAGLADEVSTDFLMLLPEEARLRIARAEAAERALRELAGGGQQP